MVEPRILRKESLGELFRRLIAAGDRIVAPVTNGDRTDFQEVTSPDQVAPDYVQTRSPAKSAVFPPFEKLFDYQLDGKDIRVNTAIAEPRPTVLFGLHPCDAASLAVLNAVFTWDSPDAYFEPKFSKTTVIGLSCTRADEFCFCTSVGGGPGDTRGSDILLTPLDGGGYLAEIVTEKGQAIAAMASDLFKPANGEAATKSKLLAAVEQRFSSAELAKRLPSLFGKNDLWVEQSLRCLGCGACAFVCPTCSCFDIQDERGRDRGMRLRCWDSCGFAMFTLHASGHNPRSKQSERWRQRVMHKFSYQPERLGVTGCVGCGRCSRTCPVDMNMADHAEALAKAST